MIERRSKILRHRVLLIEDDLEISTAAGRAALMLKSELELNDIDVVCAPGAADGRGLFLSDAGLHGVLVDWTLGNDPGAPHAPAMDLIRFIRSRNEKIPIFLLTDRERSTGLSEEVLTLVSELIWLMEDSSPFIGGRVEAAVKAYSSHLLGPMASALIEFDLVHEYSWHTPGHTGGTAFQKSPAGRLFYDYFGEAMFRSDLSISVGELGSLLDHSGPIGEGEKYAAKVFGAHRTYSVTNGTSTSNRIIWMACVGRGQKIWVDRNCHKSNEQGITMTGAVPHYLMPTRNRYGLIGPIPPANLLASKLVEGGRPVHAVITNSTYDGLTYNVGRVLEVIGDALDRIHFDEAWYGYARFHPLYRGRFAMRGDAKDHRPDEPTIFATHSTHKLLAALSQASFIHVRDGRNSIDHARFNESFMMHGSTSPFYPIIASNDVSASMMDGKGGEVLVEESIREAVAFRQMITRLWREHDGRGDWFFQTWNPTSVKNPATGNLEAFEAASPDLLVSEPSCWVLHPGEEWHGFDLEDDYCMLDPIKVSVITPGVNPDGSVAEMGFPATLLTAYLDARGIVVEKTSDYAILFLFSLGITNAKWSTLVHALLAFKRDHDANAPLAECIPSIAGFYPGAGLRDLADKMQSHMRSSQLLQVQASAFSVLPEMAMIPADCYQKLVANEVERIAVDDAAGRTAATGLVPYPPGIPMVMPGEKLGGEGEPFLAYLRAIQAWDRVFPGFAHDTHGVESEEGVYKILVLK
ncbi:MAG: Orn/Lys/Arg decarboxylase N-terminal domain-containing protein [Verrucomicrobiae bacterium]